MKKIPITAAIIGANGYSTRRLPITAAIPKDFTTIGNRPAIDFVVDNLVGAGITDIYFVIHPHHRSLYERYFQHFDDLDQHLRENGKHKELAELRAVRSRANFHFLDSVDSKGRYGTVIPLVMALNTLGDISTCLYVSSDDFTIRADGKSDLSDLVNSYHQHPGAAGALLGLDLPLDEIRNYGAIQTATREDGVMVLKGLIEKPDHPEKLEGRLFANISKHLVGEKMLPYLANPPQAANGEYYMVDVYDQVAKDHDVIIQPAKGDYYDIGTGESWLEANVKLAGTRR